jgi:hypothetical protein
LPYYVGFFPESAAIVVEALQFVKKKILHDLDRKKQTVDTVHHKILEDGYQEEIKRIDKAEAFMREKAGIFSSYLLSEDANNDFMSIIRSALEVYLKDVIKAKADTGLPGFDSRIQEIRRIINLDGPKIGKTDLFDKYYQAPSLGIEGKRLEVFLSYSNKDKEIAGKIATLLREKGVGVFLAHEDIEVSDEWRIEILKHLNNDNFLVSLLTENYEASTWANQEAGYMMGKGGKNISLVVGNTDIKKFGFLESLQGIKVEGEDFEGYANEIIECLK